MDQKVFRKGYNWRIMVFRRINSRDDNRRGKEGKEETKEKPRQREKEIKVYMERMVKKIGRNREGILCGIITA